VLDRAHKIDFLRNLDILSVPSTVDEPKGLFLLEAFANGVPAVQPRRGSYPEVLQKTGGGILVEPDSVQSLADGIFELWKDPERVAELGRRGAEGVRRHYGVDVMARRAIEVYSATISQRVHA
jgi:glycosyltransferase involved in cell wall biosynthesis